MTTKDFFHFWNNISCREHRLGNLSVRTLIFIAKRTHMADVRHLDVDCSCSICKETQIGYYKQPVEDENGCTLEREEKEKEKEKEKR
jgi:hypothetical protein